MSWDAGAISGRLLFDIGQYASNINRSMSEAASMGHELTNLEQHAQQAGHGLDETGEHAGRAGEKMGEAGEHGHGFLDVLKEHALAGVGFAAGMSAVEIAVEAVKKAFEAAVESVKKFGEMIAEVGDEAQKIGVEALEAGVQVGFFDDMAAAGKRVGVSMETLGNSFKLLQKNAVDAVSGMSQQAAEGFQMLGISTDWLKGHLDDTQAIFERFQSGLAALPTQAEQAAIALRVMGRGGNDLRPLLQMTNADMKEAIAIHHELGAAEDESSVRGAQGFIKAHAAWDDMWTGIKRAVAEPILEYLTQHWQGIRDAIIEVATVAIESIPLAFQVIEAAADPLLALMQHLVQTFKTVTDLYASLTGQSNPLDNYLQGEINAITGTRGALADVTQGAMGFREEFESRQLGHRDRSGQRSGDQYITNLQLSGIDGNAPGKIAQAIAPSIRLAQEKAAAKAAEALKRQLKHQHVSSRVAGHPITLFSGGS